MSRVLVLASSIVPLPGLPTNGGGMRGWTLAQGLKAAGHEVTLLFPRNSLDEQRVAITPEAHAAALPQTFDWDTPLAALDHFAADVLVVTSWPLAGQIRACPIPLVVDVAGPVLLERLAQGEEQAAALAHRKAAAFAAADYVTCAGWRQRTYFYAWLLISGFTPADCQARLGVIPISCDPALPSHQPPRDEPTIVFAGMALAWQDPSLALDAALQAIERRGRGHLAIYTDFHPEYSRGATWFNWLQERVRHHKRVTLHGLLPYDALVGVLQGADLALDLYAPTLERELAFNTRTVEFLRCGVPPIFGDYAELSALIQEYAAGFVVDPSATAHVTAAIALALDEPSRLADYSRNAQRLARERLAWDRTIGPLAAFCAAPSKRQPGPLTPEALVPDLAQQVQALAVQRASADHEVAGLRTYARTLEEEWQGKSAYATELEGTLAQWQRHPWRRALRQSLARLRIGNRTAN